MLEASLRPRPLLAREGTASEAYPWSLLLVLSRLTAALPNRKRLLPCLTAAEIRFSGVSLRGCTVTATATGADGKRTSVGATIAAPINDFLHLNVALRSGVQRRSTEEVHLATIKRHAWRALRACRRRRRSPGGCGLACIAAACVYHPAGCGQLV